MLEIQSGDAQCESVLAVFSEHEQRDVKQQSTFLGLSGSETRFLLTGSKNMGAVSATACCSDSSPRSCDRGFRLFREPSPGDEDGDPGLGLIDVQLRPLTLALPARRPPGPPHPLVAFQAFLVGRRVLHSRPGPVVPSSSGCASGRSPPWARWSSSRRT